MVPVWLSKISSYLDLRSRLDPSLCALLAFAAAYLAYGAWQLPVLTDWISSAVDEGYTSYAAQRIREGDWPHRDFFFLWTPGTAYFHALLQALGFDWVGERAVTLVAACTSSLLVLGWAKDWKLSSGDRALLMLLLFGWSFTLWNIPYSSWYAVLWALVAIRLVPVNMLFAGLFFGLAFWFKQNVGILATCGAAAWLFLEGRRREIFWLVGVFGLVLLLPFSAMFIWGGSEALLQALRQIFLFPLRYPSLMGVTPPKSQLAAPLTAFGLWILSLFFLRNRVSQRSAGLMQFGLLAYIGTYALKNPSDFVHGSFFLLCILAWPLSITVEFLKGDRAGFRRFLQIWLPGLGVFLQVFPRVDFQHFLFVFPITALLLLRTFSTLRQRYDFLASGWVRLPAILLAAGGLFLQWQVLRIHLVGQIDPMGRVSESAYYRLNEEVAAVRRFLLNDGLQEGGSLLVLPNATSVYRWTGFRNPTPHQQFFPGYVESFGVRESNVLPDYRARGGKYLVVQERSGLEQNYPEVSAQIERDYEELKRFPEHFTIYAPRSRQP